MSIAPLADDSPIDPDDELLVAYLDGELDAEARTDVERRLLESDALRGRLQRLQSSWEWLEELPDPAVDEKLVETTLAFVVTELDHQLAKKPSLWSRYRGFIVAAGLTAASMAIAFFVVTSRRQSAFESQLSDLVVAENLQAYVAGENMLLMRQLAANPQWIQAIDLAKQVGELQLGPASLVSEISLEDRATAIPNLNVDDRTLLATRWEQFDSLDNAKKNTLRKTAAAVAAQPDAELLLETMRTYAVWQETLPSKIRDAIRSANSKERAEAISEAIGLTQASVTRRSGTLLDDETIERIYFALTKILKSRFEKLEPARQAMVKSFQERWPTDDPELASIRYMISRDDFGRDGRRPPREPENVGLDVRRPLSGPELDMILVMLPDAALSELENLSRGDSLLEDATLTAWAEEAVRRKSFSDQREPKSLFERYEALDPSVRERVDLLPPEELLNLLTPDERRMPPRRPGPPPASPR